MLKTIISMFGNKCPNCNKGKIFEKGLLHFSFSFPKMHENCSNCGTKFVAEALITYFICMPFFEETFDLKIIPIIGVVILSLTLVNIKLSRIIWIYMFKDYSV